MRSAACYAPRVMQTPHGSLPQRRSRPAPFRPSFTLALAYVAGFFALYALLMILPELLRVLAEVPPGPEQQELAAEAAREAARPRLAYALAAALASVGLGSYLRILPGLKSR